VNLGKAGVKVSRICLGCMSYGTPPAGQPLRPGSQVWSLNEDESQPFFKQALDLGINFWDTANVYANGDSERVIGRFLKGNGKREDMVIATKLNGVMRDGPNGGGLSRKEIFFELDESLKRLQMDYVDLYQIHRWDKTTPIDETLEALDHLVRSGKVRYVGCSNWLAYQVARALGRSEASTASRMCRRLLPLSHGCGPTGMLHLVASTNCSRRPSSQRPMISSVRPTVSRSPPSG